MYKNSLDVYEKFRHKQYFKNSKKEILRMNEKETNKIEEKKQRERSKHIQGASECTKRGRPSAVTGMKTFQTKAAYISL